MAGLILPQTRFTEYNSSRNAPSAPVVETIHVKSEHDTAEGAENALLQRYILQPNNSPYSTNEEQAATAKEDGAIVVVKRISKQNANRTQAVRREIDLLWDLPHPIIPDIYEWLETPENLYLIQDNRPRRSLKQLVEMSGPVPQDGAKDVMTQLFSGIAHLFLHHIAPMRITPSEMLFDSSSNLVISNFEHAVKYSEQKEVGMPYALVTGKFGDDIYTAPEVFDEYTYNARKAVVWNCGIVLVCFSLSIE
jgi:serine/threonine protein kinase